ncbi:MAG TPA: glycosyltransferase [Galbitalea sp.]|jgi:glycosyltransferase involved in cell wall biosynthesis|nr:glycosyltransferase [Galbitalea sp.]
MASPGRPRAATIASRVFEPEGSAAAYRLGALARALEGAGFRTTVLTTRPPWRVEPVPGVRRWPVLRDATGAVRGYIQYASFDIPLFFRLLFGPRADVVVVEPPPTTGVVSRIACAIRRTPYVYYSADVSSTAAEGIGVNRTVVRMLRRMERWVLRGARLILTVSDDVADELVRLGADRDRIVVAGTGIDTTAFALEGEISNPHEPYFVYGGTMSEIQGAGVFIDAFALVAAEHPTARLLFFGSGVEFDDLRRHAAGVSNRIDVRGTVPGETLSPWLRGSTAGLASVRPARGYDFAFATKALVSLSCGAPVIYAGVGPLATVIAANDLGWSASWDAADVAAAMRDALAATRTPARSRKLSKWVDDHYSLRVVAKRGAEAISRSISG